MCWYTVCARAGGARVRAERRESVGTIAGNRISARSDLSSLGTFVSMLTISGFKQAVSSGLLPYRFAQDFQSCVMLARKGILTSVIVVTRVVETNQL